MNKFFLLMVWGVSLTFLTSSAEASPQSCDALFLAVQQSFELAQNKQGEGKQTAVYSVGANRKLYVSCTLGKPNVAVYLDGSTPDTAFYDLVGRVGNLLLQRPATEVVKYAKQCQQDASKDDIEIATVEREGFAIECQSYTRDGGGTSITVFAE